MYREEGVYFKTEMEGLSLVQIQLSSPLPPTGVSDINLQEYLQTSFCEILTGNKNNNNNNKNHVKVLLDRFHLNANIAEVKVNTPQS